MKMNRIFYCFLLAGSIGLNSSMAAEGSINEELYEYIGNYNSMLSLLCDDELSKSDIVSIEEEIIETYYSDKTVLFNDFYTDGIQHYKAKEYLFELRTFSYNREVHQYDIQDVLLYSQNASHQLYAIRVVVTLNSPYSQFENSTLSKGNSFYLDFILQENRDKNRENKYEIVASVPSTSKSLIERYNSQTNIEERLDSIELSMKYLLIAIEEDNASNQKGYIDNLLLAEEYGMPYSDVFLASAYYDNYDLSEDGKLTFKYINKALESMSGLEHPMYHYFQFLLSVCYHRGWGVEEDYNKSLRWLKVAAQHDSYAMYKLGMIYIKGLGVEKNISLGLSYWDSAADLDHNIAQFNMAKEYELGVNVAKNEKRAIELYKKGSCTNIMGIDILADDYKRIM